jgi:chromosome partitioning protein
MIVMIGSQKGGCGKSTVSYNICAALAQQGKDIILVDTDEKQPTGANWAGDRANIDAPKVHCIQKYGKIRDTLRDLDKRYEYVIVDAAGRDSRELRSGMTVADILIVPFRPSQADLDTLYHMQEVVSQALDVNPDMKVFGLITMAPTNPIINETREAKEFLQDFPEIKLLKTLIRDRKVYRDALSEGLGVVEMNNHKAKSEINGLMREVFNHG